MHVAADFGPYGSRRDERGGRCRSDGRVELQRLGSPYAVAPGRVLNGSGDPYRVYSPFQRSWAEHGWRDPADPPPTDQRWAALPGDPIPRRAAARRARAPAGRRAGCAGRVGRLPRRAARRLRRRPQPAGDRRGERHVDVPEVGRDPPAHDAARTSAPGTSAATYRKELAWREFYADVLWHHPASAREDLRASSGRWSTTSPGRCSRRGRRAAPGFPIVDAGMRQLLATGRIHNRVRMVCASFLVKDLHVWWWHGARHFMEWLADGDLASNQHNWQWVAGSGTDAAPYFRVFNPTTQGRKFDPDGDYVRRWVPELRDVPADEIHEPTGVPGYPAPVVDHADGARGRPSPATSGSGRGTGRDEARPVGRARADGR